MNTRRAFLLVLGLTISGACSDPTASDADGGGGSDSGSSDAPPSMRDGATPTDAGPIRIRDGGSCDSWGISEPGAPITGLNAGQWTWVDVPEAHCMNGSSTGFGVNLGGTEADRVIIYLEGGGVCFDFITCSGAANANGFDRADFTSATSALSNYGIFRRGDASNPFREWTHVYVPYCSGDTHAGTAVEGFEGREQVGYTNMTHFLRRLAPTFRADLEMGVLAGSSAGGLGAMANYDQVAQAFGCAPIHLIDDSGPILPQEFLRPCLQLKAMEIFDVPLPADCPQCDPRGGGELFALWEYLVTKYPDRRFAQLSYTGDQTMRNFYGYGLHARCSFPQMMSEAQFAMGLDSLRTRLAGYPQVATWIVSGTSHTFLPGVLNRSSIGSTRLAAWLEQMISNDAAWDDLGP